MNELIEIILSDRVYMFSVVLCLVAVWTMKDLAVCAAIISVIGSFVWYENLPNESTYAAFCVLNLMLAAIAGAYNLIENTILSKVIAVLGAMFCVLNGVQLFDITPVSGYVSTVLIVIMIFSLMFIDGRRKLFSGIIPDFRASHLRHLHRFSRKNSNQGR